MKRFQFKQKRHLVTAVCLLVGTLVLTTSVYANFDNASGYSNYKSAVKKLLLNTNNVTLEAKGEFYIDGELMGGVEENVKFGDKGMSTYEREYDKKDLAEGTNSYECYTYQDGETRTYYDPEANTYQTYDSYYEAGSSFTGADMDDKTTQKLVKFLELGADLVIGDLKNNVVLTGEDDDTLEYQIDVSKSQMPEIVNAGLSLLFGTINEDTSDRSGIWYEDYNDALESYLVNEYGGEYNANPYDDNGNYDPQLGGYATEDEYYDAWSDYQDDFNQHYDDIYADQFDREGVLYINSDGSYDHYDSYDEYLNATGDFTDSDYTYRMFGEDPYIENAKMTVKMSKKGELLYNELEVTLAGHDADGAKHTATFKGVLSASDYGTTVADVFDPTGKEKEN